ncbi:hypothetical protein [Nonomuraea guangzhouensis]|uniref:DUF4240 domain-containing protein n=1 Tax=Nonomuraea guangzhouensis TaxID=1291555 RepID=A0ABW4GQU6_9ACTN|nr:hypothetical protein [Nonomuraea guangzhouensis]
MTHWMTFWKLIDVGLRDPDELARRIDGMSEHDLVEFYWTYEECAADLKDEEFLRYVSPPRTEDYVDDLAQWIVAQGLDYYEDIMLQPTKMPPELPSGATVPPWTGLVSRVYRQRYDTPVRFREDPPPGQSFDDHPSFHSAP